MIRIQVADGTFQQQNGIGAGRWPTATSIIADLLDLARTFGEPSEGFDSSAESASQDLAAI